MTDKDHHEIIFIRKSHGDDEEGHHGGVWKLAFADFMTAMMAFFLVMWLINSASKETKTALVQYFNPVQLVDSNPAHKGLRDPQSAGQGKSVEAAPIDTRGAVAANTRESGAPQQEAALLYDPIATLDQIAGKPPRETTFGDPFDRNPSGTGYVDTPVEEGAAVDNAARAPVPDDRDAKPAPSTPTKDSKSSLQPPRAAELAARDTKLDTSVPILRSSLEKIVRAEAASSRSAPRFEVAETPEGVLISLTDDANFSMFAVGSVEPRPQAVRVIAQIGRILAKQSGDIELRGHTDARSYKSQTYDNWRLSSDRANMAYYMLARGGLPEKRVVKIAGYADRQLKISKEPLAAVNRRIEILLRRVDR